MSRFKDVLDALGDVILETGLKEEKKWGQRCFTHDGKNIIVIGELKAYAVAGFFKGYLLKDPKKILFAQGPNTKEARSVKFESVEDVRKLESTLKKYIAEAIKIQNDSLK